MANWPPVTPSKSHQEKEKTYLTLVDMFVDAVEPSIIQMVLQNRNWDLDAALEDIMILSSTSLSEKKRPSSNVDLRGIEKKGSSNKGNVNNLVEFGDKKTSFDVSTNPLKRKSKSLIEKTSSNRSKATEVSKRAIQSNLLPFVEHYNYVKTVPVAVDRTVMLIKDGVKLMIILRGPPGSGKSYLAKRILSESGIDPSINKRHIFSSDDFFMQNNVYVFVPDLLSQAHMWNQHNVAAAIREEISPIIIDNTNTQTWEMKVYAEMAVSGGYDIEIVEPDTWWFSRENELAKRNVHSVPKAKIRNMVERYEKNITPHMLLRQFNLRYSLSKAPPQPVRNCRIRDKLSSQRNNKPKKKKNEFNPKAPSKFDSLSSNFQNLCLDSPNDTSRIPPLPPALSKENGQNQNFSFYESDNFFQHSEKGVQDAITNLKNGEHYPVKSLDFPYIFQNAAKNSQVLESCHDNVETMAQGIPSYSSIFSSKHFSLPVSGNQSPAKTSSLNLKDSLNQLNDGFSETSNELYGTIDPSVKHYQGSFDFIAESKKLLAALNKSVDYEESITSNEHQKECPLLNLSEPNFNDIIFVCKSNEIILANKLDSKSMFEASPDKLEEREIQGEKLKEAKEIVHSLIDKAVDCETDLLTSHKEYIETDPTENIFKSSELLLDYVLVNDDKTYTYKRLDALPLIENLPFNEIPSPSNINSTPKGIMIDEEQSEYVTENKSSCNFSHEGDIIQAGFEKVEATAMSVNACSENYLHGRILEASQGFEMDDTSSSQSENHNILRLTTPSVEEMQVSSDRFMSSSEAMHISTIENSGSKQSYSQLANNTSSDIMVMMNDILNSMGQPSEKLNSSSNSKIDTTDLAQDPNIEFKNVRSTNFFKTPESYLDDWEKGVDWDNQTKICTESNNPQPKPPRSLSRPKLLSNLSSQNSGQVNSCQKQDSFSQFGNWNTVVNPLEHWGLTDTSNKDDCSSPKIESYALPQRSKVTYRKTNSSATNTNYLDFSLLNEENPIGVKILTGNPKNISPDSTDINKQPMSETLLLDKGTMTMENSLESDGSFDIKQISSFFPNIPERYILDMVERCQGDIDWAVDLLLDSEHCISLEDNEDEGNQKENKDEPGTEESHNASLEVSQFHDEGKISPIHEIGKNSLKQDIKSSIAQEQAEIKRLIENSVVFDKSHYSDKILKVLKKKHPKYLNLIEGNLPQEENESDGLGCENNFQCIQNNVGKHFEDFDNDKTEEGYVSSTCGSDFENEDETLEFVVNNDLILQLQQKFGNSSAPKITNLSPVVKLPVSLARQLFGYIMDSLQSDMDEQQTLIEHMIAKDEEVARLLQYQDNHFKPQLQEIIDMEVALAVHKADQEEFKGIAQETLAAKLSKNILLEKFPHVDPKMLIEVLHAHNYSLHDASKSLTLSLDEGLCQDKVPTDLIPSSLEMDLQKSWERQNQTKTRIVLATEGVSTGTDLRDEAQALRDQAASYYSLRMDCLNKAHEAFRSGNKAVATYYSQLAQMHKDKVEHCNSQAATCLLSSHKTGANTLDLHFLHVTEAEIVLDMFLDEVISYITEKKKKHQRVYLITGRGLRSVGGVSRIKPMAQRKLNSRKILYNDVNPGMLSALVRDTTPLSCNL